MALILGIDEAGRGPVIGPMVIAGVLLDDNEEERLVNIGVKDSKLLTPQRREALFERIQEIAKNHVILVIEPEEIDNALRDAELNLNWLEAHKSAEIINYIQPVADEVILDCPSTNPMAYMEYMRKILDVKTKLRAEHKADFNYPIVAAASILAKVTRDRLIEKIKRDIGVDFGSGYPADPITKAFLEKNWDKHRKIFRQTWSSYKNASGFKKQKILGEF